MKEKKIEKLYKLLEKGNLDNETNAALKWAIFELQEPGKITIPSCIKKIDFKRLFQ